MSPSRLSLRLFALVVPLLCLQVFSLVGCGRKTPTRIPPLPVSPAPASSYAGYNPNTGHLSIGNGLVEFRWSISESGPARYVHKQTGHIGSFPDDFQFQIGDVRLSPANNTLEYTDYSLSSFPGGGRQLTLHFAYGKPEPQLEVLVEYALVPSLSGIRKQTRLRNLTDQTLTVSNVYLHRVDMAGMTPLNSHQQSAAQAIPKGTHFSALIPDNCMVTWLHEGASHLKHWSHDSGRLVLGLPPDGHPWATHIRLVTGAELELPAVHSVYQADDGTGNIGDAVQQYADRFLPHSAAAHQIAKASFLVDNETPIAEIPEPPEGVDLIIAEYGWESDEATLARLEEMESLMHKAGLRFGLQVPLAQFPDPEALDPTWAYQLDTGQPWNLPQGDKQVPVYCLASDYALFIGTKLSELVEQYHLDALLLTGPIFGSPEAEVHGCHAFNHDHYGVTESAWEAHKHLALITDFLHHQVPGLLLITTEELWGAPFPDESVFALFDQVVGDAPGEALWHDFFLKQYQY